MFIKLNNTNYNRKLVKCLFARGGKWYAELVNGEQFTISQSDFQTATDGMNAINGVYYFADVIAKVEVEEREEPSPEPPSGDLTAFAVGDDASVVQLSTTIDNNSLNSLLDDLVFSSDNIIPILTVKQSFEGQSYENGIIVAIKNVNESTGQIDDQHNGAILIGANEGSTFIWLYADKDTSLGNVFIAAGWQSSGSGQLFTFDADTRVLTTNLPTGSTQTYNSSETGFNGVLFGKVADKSSKLLKAETTADYTAHFKNGNTFPIDGTTFAQLTADFCQIGGAYYNPSIINRLYATNQPKYFVEFVNGQTLEITAQEYYDILWISGAKI